MYKRTLWQDHVEGVQTGTDLNAANLNNIEVGTLEANALAALDAAYRRYEHDILKDLEVYTAGPYTISDEQDTVILISRRNNTNYRVVPEFTSNSGFDANIYIVDKQLDSFTVRRSSSGTGEISAMFHVSGGMI